MTHEELLEHRRLERNRKRRERYANDPEFRARCLKMTRDWQRRQDPEWMREYQKEANIKYITLHREEYLARKREYSRRARAKKKEEMQKNGSETD